MKVIKVEISPVRAGDQVSGVIMKQRRRNGSWSNEEAITVVSGDKSEAQVLVLNDDQRIVVETTTQSAELRPAPQVAVVPRSVPKLVADSDEDSPAVSAADIAAQGLELQRLLADEKRAALLTQARMRLKRPPTIAEAPPPPKPIWPPPGVGVRGSK